MRPHTGDANTNTIAAGGNDHAQLKFAEAGIPYDGPRQREQHRLPHSERDQRRHQNCLGLLDPRHTTSFTENYIAIANRLQYDLSNSC